jgi:hypothetical protein
MCGSVGGRHHPFGQSRALGALVSQWVGKASRFPHEALASLVDPTRNDPRYAALVRKLRFS